MWRQLHLCLISSKSQGIKQESVLLFTTWKGTWHVFYLAQSGNWITITMEYLARLFQPTFKSKQLVFRGAARGALLPWGSLSPSPQHPPPQGVGWGWGHHPAQEGNSPGLDFRVNFSEMPEMQPCGFPMPLAFLCVLAATINTLTLSEFPYGIHGEALVLCSQSTRGRRGKKSSVHLLIQLNGC